MKRLHKTTILFLISISLIGLFLRLYRLSSNTPLYTDEVGQYYIFEALKQHSVGWITQLAYLSFSFTWLVGLNFLGVRLPSALYGSFIGLAIYFLAKSVSNRKAVAIIAGILGTFLPWSFMISRIGHTHIPVIVLLTTLHCILYLRAKTIKQILYSLLPLAISSYLYPAAFIISVFALLLPARDIYYKIILKQRKMFKVFFLTILVFLVSLGIFRFKILNVTSRGLDLAIWRDGNVTAEANNYRGLARLSDPTLFSFNQDPEVIGNKIVYNYPLSVINVFVRNYLSFFSPDFLFLKGDNVLRHSTGIVGEFFPFLLPFMIYGAFVFFQRADKKVKTVFLVWILISPIPAAITKDGATYLLRVITMMPFLTYFCALGLISSFDLFKGLIIRYLFGAILFFISLFSVYYFYYGYFQVYPALSAQSFEFGFKELADFQQATPGAMLVIWDDKYPVNYFCFWQRLPFVVCDPKQMAKNELVNTTRVDLPTSSLLFTLPKNENDLVLIINQYKPRYLVVPTKLVGYFVNIEKKYSILQTILNPDQTPAFKIYKVL